MAYSSETMSQEQKQKKYQKMKNQSIFGEEDCVTVPKPD